jgi:hypothetical protein
MNKSKLLLNAYFEALHDLLFNQREVIKDEIDELLRTELAKLVSVTDEKIAAYMDASIAFLDERLEMYNPVGLQYLYDNQTSEFARQIELQLDWYDSSIEFQSIFDAVDVLTKSGFEPEQLPQLARQLVKKFGAFPDRSIIEYYLNKPSTRKLPDYILARAIEKIIKESL